MSRKLVELARLAPGDTVLDIAAGYGEPGLTAARTVAPDGHVTCVDISADMLALARQRAHDARLDNVEFIEADAETLQLPPSSYDAILSRTGLQFLPDIAGSLQRLRRTLKPHGRLAAIVWGPPHKVPFASAFTVIARQLDLPAGPPPGPGPFALADPDKLALLVEGAGFHQVTTGSLTVTLEMDTARRFTEFIRDAAPIEELLEGQPEHRRQRIWQEITATYDTLATADGTIRTDNEALWVTGTTR